MPLDFDARFLFLPRLGLRLDPHRPSPFAFISHGHADHFARHTRILCSEPTGHLLVSRFGVKAATIETLPWDHPLEISGHEIRLFPAGHITGSAMIHISHDGQSLLYTGDFKTRPSRTAETAIFPQADTLIMETTFGLPHFIFPPTEQVEKEIVAFANAALTDQETPVFFAYSLGKAQEVLAILDANKITCYCHRTVFEMTTACRELGVSLPEPLLLGKNIPPGVAVIAPPNAVRSRAIRSQKSRRTAMITGWALTPGSQYRYQVDAVFPLSDHADFPGLLEAVQKVAPSKVLTLHGSTRPFAAHLRSLGYEAWSIYGDDQLELSLTTEQSPAPEKNLTRPDCDTQALSELFVQLTATPSRLQKTSLLATFLQSLPTDLLAPLIRWLSGNATANLGPAMIRQALLDVSGFPLARYRALSSSQNDTARTARLVLDQSKVTPAPLSFPDLAQFFSDLNHAPGSLAKIALLRQKFSQTHPRESETLVRLLTGGLRIGAKEGLFEEAIAQAFAAPLKDVRQALMLSGDLAETALAAQAGQLTQVQLRPGTPIKPMLASPSVDAADLLAWHGDPENPLWLEAKFDGIRCQLHVTNGQASLFSRDLRSLNHEFPELLKAAQSLPDCLLDGELIASADGKRLTFFDLQKRLGRKKTSGDLFLTDDIPVRFFAFDCLYAHEPLVTQPLAQRRKILESLPFSDPFFLLTVHRPPGDNLATLEETFKKSLSDGHEGLVAKDPNSPYQPGRRGQAWRKLKGVMPTLDCVVIAAQQGHGKRAGVLSDYTFAVRDEGSGELRTLGKAYSGLTDLEIEELTDHFQKTSIEKISSRVLRVKPTIVLEIAFDQIRPSKRHDSGLALRFPRIKAIRRDKSPDEIDTLKTAQKLVT